VTGEHSLREPEEITMKKPLSLLLALMISASAVCFSCSEAENTENAIQTPSSAEGETEAEADDAGDLTAETGTGE